MQNCILGLPYSQRILVTLPFIFCKLGCEHDCDTLRTCFTRQLSSFWNYCVLDITQNVCMHVREKHTDRN